MLSYFFVRMSQCLKAEKHPVGKGTYCLFCVLCKRLILLSIQYCLNKKHIYTIFNAALKTKILGDMFV